MSVILQHAEDPAAGRSATGAYELYALGESPLSSEIIKQVERWEQCHIVRMVICRTLIDGASSRWIGATHARLVFEFIDIVDDTSSSWEIGQAMQHEVVRFRVVSERGPAASNMLVAVDTLSYLPSAPKETEIIYTASFALCTSIDYNAHLGKEQPCHVIEQFWPFIGLLNCSQIKPDLWPRMKIAYFVKLLQQTGLAIGRGQPAYGLTTWNCWWYVERQVTLLTQTNLVLCMQDEYLGPATAGMVFPKGESSREEAFGAIPVGLHNRGDSWMGPDGLALALRTWQATNLGTDALQSLRTTGYGLGILGLTLSAPKAAALLVHLILGPVRLLKRADRRLYITKRLSLLSSFDSQIEQLFYKDYLCSGQFAFGTFDPLCPGWWELPADEWHELLDLHDDPEELRHPVIEALRPFHEMDSAGLSLNKYYNLLEEEARKLRRRLHQATLTERAANWEAAGLPVPNWAQAYLLTKS